MSATAMIFNGLHFYLPVAERAFARAKQGNGQVIAIFLKARYEKKEGYGFPDDLNLAEDLATDKDADTDDAKIIESNRRLLEHQAVTGKVELHTQLLEDPSAEQFKTALQDADVIFIQGHDEHGYDTPAGIDVKKLLAGISIPVEIVQ
jgi:hypothetical protein